MCLPLCCLKKIVQLEGWLILLLSILAFVAALIITLIEKGLIDAINNAGYNEIDSLGMAVAFWVFAGSIFVLAICGIVGARKKNKCLLAIFNIGNICVFLAFLSLAIAAYVVGSAFNPDDQLSKCDATSPIEQFYKTAEENLCKDNCGCQFTGDVAAVNKEYPGAITKSSKDDKSYVTNAQSCSYFPKEDTKQALQASGLEWIESKFECSGWCKKYPIQMFNDVNTKVNGLNYPCYYAMYEYAQNVGYSMGNVLISIAGVLGLFVLFTCCLCWHPENSKSKGTDYYSRMAYYDE